MLRLNGLEHAADARLATYSKGMLQRIGIAQALLHDPPVLLLDEPASGLDPAGRLALGDLVRRLAAGGKTVVLSSHVLPQAEDLCDYFLLLGRGRVLAQGSAAELLGREPRAEQVPTRLEALYLARTLSP